MSLGGLILVAQTVSSVIVFATASASREVNFGDSGNVIAGRSRTENHNPTYGADCQRRPYCPRPFVWRSAKTTNPAGDPRPAASQATSFVDSVSSRTTISFPIRCPSRPARSSDAINRSLVPDMRQFQRQVDRTRGMSQRADGDVIDSGGGDPAHVLQIDSTARFKFHLPLPRRDRLSHFRRLHVVEENDVDAVHS